MPERDQLDELAMMLSKEAAEKLVRIPGIDAVCITLVGADEVPLGIILSHPDKYDGVLLLKAIRKLSDHIDTLAKSIIEEIHARSGKNGPHVGGPERAQCQPDASGQQAGIEDRCNEPPSTP